VIGRIVELRTATGAALIGGATRRSFGDERTVREGAAERMRARWRNTFHIPTTTIDSTHQAPRMTLARTTEPECSRIRGENSGSCSEIARKLGRADRDDARSDVRPRVRRHQDCHVRSLEAGW
jgi:hypothetical protein